MGSLKFPASVSSALDTMRAVLSLIRRLDGATIRTSYLSGNTDAADCETRTSSFSFVLASRSPVLGSNRSSHTASRTLTVPKSTGVSRSPPSVSSASTIERTPSGKRRFISVAVAVILSSLISYPRTPSRPPNCTGPPAMTPAMSSNRTPSGSKTIRPSISSKPCGSDKCRSRPPSTTASPRMTGCRNVPPISATRCAMPELRRSGKKPCKNVRFASPSACSVIFSSTRPTCPARVSAVPSPTRSIC